MLDSIIEQARLEPELQAEFEVVVVDNGLDDVTCLLMEDMCAAYPFISYVRRPYSVPMEESILAGGTISGHWAMTMLWSKARCRSYWATSDRNPPKFSWWLATHGHQI
jgi:hypothetical protein